MVESLTLHSIPRQPVVFGLRFPLVHARFRSFRDPECHADPQPDLLLLIIGFEFAGLFHLSSSRTLLSYIPMCKYDASIGPTTLITELYLRIFL